MGLCYKNICRLLLQTFQRIISLLWNVKLVLKLCKNCSPCFVAISKLEKKPFMVTLDHEHKAVLVSIRGTISKLVSSFEITSNLYAELYPFLAALIWPETSNLCLHVGRRLTTITVKGIRYWYKEVVVGQMVVINTLPLK